MRTIHVRSAPGRVLAAALGFGLSACSFVGVQRPRSPVDDPRVADPCTTSVGAPVADSVVAGAALVAAYVAMVVAIVDSADCGAQGGSCSSSSGDPGPALAFLGAGALFGSSAVYGYVSTHQCRRRIVLSGRCEAGDLGACRRVQPGWTPPPGMFAPRSPAPPSAVPPTAAPPTAAPPSPPGAGGQEWIEERSAPQPAPDAPAPPPG